MTMATSNQAPRAGARTDTAERQAARDWYRAPADPDKLDQLRRLLSRLSARYGTTVTLEDLAEASGADLTAATKADVRLICDRLVVVYGDMLESEEEAEQAKARRLSLRNRREWKKASYPTSPEQVPAALDALIAWHHDLFDQPDRGKETDRAERAWERARDGLLTYIG
jgi:hypothetical protein